MSFYIIESKKTQQKQRQIKYSVVSFARIRENNKQYKKRTSNWMRKRTSFFAVVRDKRDCDAKVTVQLMRVFVLRRQCAVDSKANNDTLRRLLEHRPLERRAAGDRLHCTHLGTFGVRNVKVVVDERASQRAIDGDLFAARRQCDAERIVLHDIVQQIDAIVALKLIGDCRVLFLNRHWRQLIAPRRRGS